MKKNLFLIIVLGFSLNCLAQGFVNETISRIEHSTELDRMQNSSEVKYANVKGSPYLTDYFVPATIYPDDKLFFVKYNAVDDEITVKLSADRVIVLDNNFKKYTIVFKESNQTFVTLKESDKAEPGYFIEVKKADNISLYKKKTIKYFPETKATDNYSKNKAASFSKTKDTYYIQLTPDGPVKLMPKKKKSFLALFGNNQSDIKDYMGKNKTKLSKESDLVPLFTFIESL